MSFVSALFLTSTQWNVLWFHPCLPVHPSVCLQFYSETTHLFLIFCTKVEIYNSGKLRESKVSGKFPKWPQSRIFFIFWKILSYPFTLLEINAKLIVVIKFEQKWYMKLLMQILNISLVIYQNIGVREKWVSDKKQDKNKNVKGE